MPGVTADAVRSRLYALGLVAALHGLLVIAISVAVRSQRGSPQSEQVMVWLPLASVRPAPADDALRGRAVFSADELASPPVAPAPAAPDAGAGAPTPGTALRAAITDWGAEREAAARRDLDARRRAELQRRSLDPRRVMTTPDAPPPDKGLPWSHQPKPLLDTPVLDLTLDHGLEIGLFDQCVIVDLLAFGCRVGKKAAARGDLFDDARQHLDRRVTDPLP